MIVPHSRPTLGRDDIDAVAKVVASGMIAQGEKVREFEHLVARFVGVKHAVACSSGTSALHLALFGLGVGSGDEVIVPSFVCSSPFFAALHSSAVPRIVDIASSGFNVSAKSVEVGVSSRTKVVVVPHMFGSAAKVDEVRGLGIPVVEDCALALGAEYNGRRVGGFGELSVFSFYATKMITTGEGGMILTDNKEFYASIVGARDYDGKSLDTVRFNYKMTDFQAALGINQLGKLKNFIARRRELAKLYDHGFESCGVVIPETRNGPVYYRYVVLVGDPVAVRAEARECGIHCERPVFLPLHRGLGVSGCPHSDQAFDHALSVPIYPGLSDEEAGYVVDKLSKIFMRHPAR
jgi:perosamine synthetase